MYRILLEENTKPIVEPQMRLNPNIKKLVRVEILKWLDTRIIFPNFDSVWISPIHVVPKKDRMMEIVNENYEIIPIRVIAEWRVCIDYRMLNESTR